MLQEKNDRKLEFLLSDIELPQSAYESAARRYHDLGEWFDRKESTVTANSPHIFVQGSFALGTAIKPIRDGEEYDLDLSCKLRAGITRESSSQKDLKELIGAELHLYRTARQIREPLESKHRCWRLQYQDALDFHMDIVPAIPADAQRRAELIAIMETQGVDRKLASDVAADAVWITDDRLPNYSRIDPTWQASNPEGYVRWFVSRMEGVQKALRAEAKVDDVPIYRRKSNLQRVIQLLKRHRDIMFQEHPDCQPISIIITTLAGEAYRPGQTFTQSLQTVLAALAAFRNSHSDVVLNPVNSRENFADRWAHPDCRHLRLKANFHLWVDQACGDFLELLKSGEPRLIREMAETRLGLKPSSAGIAAALGLACQSTTVAASPRHVEIVRAAPPWRP